MVFTNHFRFFHKKRKILRKTKLKIVSDISDLELIYDTNCEYILYDYFDILLLLNNSGKHLEVLRLQIRIYTYTVLVDM